MTILERILETKRAEVERARSHRPLHELRAASRDAEPARAFLAAVTSPSPHGPQLIAELKRKSPSAGLLRAEFDPTALARIYERHGAAAISVLTDETYFGGRLEFLREVRQAVALPVLRKEFIIDEYQVYESRVAGADAVLLIVEAIGVSRVAEWLGLVHELGMGCLIEVHSETNLLELLDRLGPPVQRGGASDKERIDGPASSESRVRQAGWEGASECSSGPPSAARSRNRHPADPVPYVLGMNHRDLSVQRTDLGVTARLARHLPDGSAFVAESGLTSRGDVEAVHRAGACAILVGETLLRQTDIGRKIDELLGTRTEHA